MPLILDASASADPDIRMLNMDWGTIVPAAIVGAVGLAGIGGTLLSARMTINATNEREKLAEKRRIYAQALATITTYIATPEKDRSQAALAMYSAVQDVVLIAPGDLARQILAIEGDLRNKRMEEAFAGYAELTTAMREELAWDKRDRTLLQLSLRLQGRASGTPAPGLRPDAPQQGRELAGRESAT